MDPHQSKGPPPAESISKVKVKMSSAWIKKSHKLQVKQEEWIEVATNVVARVRHLVLEAFQDSGEWCGGLKRKCNHLFDVDTDRGLVILGLYVPGELRLTPAYGKFWFPPVIFASLSNEETPKEALNLLVIVRPKAKLQQPVEWVHSKVDKGAAWGQHDGFSWGPKLTPELWWRLQNHPPPKNSCNFRPLF